MFCSRLVAQAYQHAGISLVENPDYCTPEELKKSSLLTSITPSTIDISDEEYSKWQDSKNIIILMEKATNNVLNCVRQLDNSIETLNDIDAYLLSNPDKDEIIHQCFVESGYLDVWAIEFEENPWHHDIQLMEELHIDSPERKLEVEYFCKKVVTQKDVTNRYAIQKSRYEQYCRKTGLRTFEALKNLYTQLEKLEKSRLETVCKWLKNNTK